MLIERMVFCFRIKKIRSLVILIVGEYVYFNKFKNYAYWTDRFFKERYLGDASVPPINFKCTMCKYNQGLLWRMQLKEKSSDWSLLSPLNSAVLSFLILFCEMESFSFVL